VKVERSQVLNAHRHEPPHGRRHTFLDQVKNASVAVIVTVIGTVIASAITDMGPMLIELIKSLIR
jgi:hypothetical protein